MAARSRGGGTEPVDDSPAGCLAVPLRRISDNWYVALVTRIIEFRSESEARAQRAHCKRRSHSGSSVDKRGRTIRCCTIRFIPISVRFRAPKGDPEKVWDTPDTVWGAG